MRLRPPSPPSPRPVRVALMVCLVLGCATEPPAPIAARPGWPAWPADMAPAECPIHVTNERVIDAPAERIWQWLVRFGGGRGVIHRTAGS